MPDYRNYSLSMKEWGKYSGQGILLALVISLLFYRSKVAFVAFSPLAVILPLAMRSSLAVRRREMLAGQFKDGALAVAAALSAGYSIENAWTEAAKEMEIVYGADGYITREFRGICRKLSVNRTSEEAVGEFASRSGVAEIQQFAEVFAAAKRSSGSLAPILRDTAALIAKKIQLQEEIRTMAAARRLELNIMSLMPAGILLYINLGSPGFTDPLYQGILGRSVMTFCLLLYGFAIGLGRWMLEVKV